MSVDAASGCGSGPGSIRITWCPRFFNSIAAVIPLTPAPTTMPPDMLEQRTLWRRSPRRAPMLFGLQISQGPFPFEQSRMRVIKAAVERMGREIAQVVFGQCAERLNQRLRLSHCATGKCVRLVFETARPNVDQRRKPKTNRPRQQREQQHSGNDI